MSGRREHKQQGVFMHRKQLTRWIGLSLAALVGGTSLFATSFTMAATTTKVVICHRGKTLIVTEGTLQKYLDQGATRGACVVTECRN